MDRYDRIILDIQQRTRDGRLQWKVVRPTEYARILMSLDRVPRAFRAEYALQNKHYALLFVERRGEHLGEYGELVEFLSLELFVLDEDGEIVFPLYDGVVDRDDLLKLSALIDEHNDRAKGFFSAFEGSEVA